MKRNFDPKRKILASKKLLPEIVRARIPGTLVLTNGCFDLLHAGHVETLTRARMLGDGLLVLVNSDASIRRLKGPDRPLRPLRERLLLLASLECVTIVSSFSTRTPVPLLKRLQPDILVKGGDYAHDEVVGHDVVEGYGGRVHTIPPIKGVSTTTIAQRIRRK